MDPTPRIEASTREPGRLHAAGEWTLAHAEAMLALLKQVPERATRLDGCGIHRLDSAGVLLLSQYAQRLGLGLDDVEVRPEHRALVEAVEGVSDDRPPRRRDYGFVALLGRIGYGVKRKGNELLALIAFFGEALLALLRLAKNPARLRLTSTVHHMEQVGMDAVPLVALLSFMIGAVVAFLGAGTLADFGAEVYVVELVTYSFLREFGVLLTAIILAGRTASAFTAQIGAMKSREEIDAIRTLGLDPMELLVLPRLLALLVMLPLLTFIAMLAGLVGGALVGMSSLDIPFPMYFQRTHDIIYLQDFWVGISKAPIFAAVIALIGCLEGMQVEGTAQSVGEHTTSSVVQSLSLVIVLDAVAALFFQEMGW